jgi:hypothetical protein
MAITSDYYANDGYISCLKLFQVSIKSVHAYRWLCAHTSILMVSTCTTHSVIISLRQAPVRLNDALATSDNNGKLVLPSRSVERHPEPLHLCECNHGSHIEHRLKQMTTDSVLNPDGVLLVDSELRCSYRMHCKR